MTDSSLSFNDLVDELMAVYGLDRADAEAAAERQLQAAETPTVTLNQYRLRLEDDLDERVEQRP